MKSNFTLIALIAMVMAMIFSIGLLVSCSGDDDDNDAGGVDDDTGGGDDCDIANPLPTAECSNICNAENCDTDSPAYECMNPEGFGSVDECISGCMDSCQAGCIPANVMECMAAFTDCDTLYECMGINPNS